MGRAETVTDFVKRYDPKLYCESSEGKLCIYRKGQRIESYDVDGVKIDFVRPAPHYVLALTEDWSYGGEPCDRGLEQIRDRLLFNDLWNRDLVKEIREYSDARDISNERKLDNHLESYLKENRKAFARATNDINTSTINKRDLRQIKGV